MKDSEFHNFTFYENYIHGKLTKEQEDLFEEHLLTCAYCQEELETTERIVLESKRYFPKSERTAQQKKIVPKYLLGIVASIVIVLSVSIYFVTKNSNNKIVQKPVIADTIPKVPESEEEIIAETAQPEEKNDAQQAYNHSAKYNVLPEFENAIKNITRSETINVLSPITSAIYHPGDTIIFNWKSDTENLFLVLFSNQGDILFEQLVKVPFRFTKSLDKGLYYWQIEDDNDSYYTGKFTIK